MTDNGYSSQQRGQDLKFRGQQVDKRDMLIGLVS